MDSFSARRQGAVCGGMVSELNASVLVIQATAHLSFSVGYSLDHLVVQVTQLYRSLSCTDRSAVLITQLYRSLNCTDRSAVLITQLYRSLNCTDHSTVQIAQL